jgi:hypothetical protein
MKNTRISLVGFGTIAFLILILVGLVGCSTSAPATASQSGPTYPLEISWLDKTGQFTLDSQGRLKSTVQLSSTDGSLSLFIYSGTKVLDKDNQPLQSIKATVDSQPPLLPENAGMVGAVYDLGPVGSQFTPAPQITIGYNPADIPGTANEGDLYAAYYQNGNWTSIPFKRIDAVNHKITTTVDHGTKLAVLLPLQETTTSTPIVTSTTAPNPNAVKVVVAGYMSHGPLTPTVQAIKDVLAKYGDKVAVTWVDLGTKEGAAYFKQNGLTAHMNVIINGKYTYEVNGKTVTFQWFEGQQWNKADLDAVLASLVSK